MIDVALSPEITNPKVNIAPATNTTIATARRSHNTAETSPTLNIFRSLASAPTTFWADGSSAPNNS